MKVYSSIKGVLEFLGMLGALAVGRSTGFVFGGFFFRSREYLISGSFWVIMYIYIYIYVCVYMYITDHTACGALIRGALFYETPSC